MRHRGVRHGVNHLGAVLGDAALLEIRADDIARDVVQEQERHVDLVVELNELRRLLRGFREQWAVVAEDADGVAVQRRPARHQRGAVEGLELLEAGAIDDAGDHLAHVEGHTQVLIDDAEQLFRVVKRVVGRHGGAGAQLAPIEVRHHLAAHANAIEFVQRQVVAQTGSARMHVGAGEGFIVRILAGGHLHQGWPAQGHLGLPLDEDVVVAHAGLVSAAGGGGAEHHRNGGNAHLRQFGDLVEEPPGLGEVPALAPDGGFRVTPAPFATQIRPGGFHELHVGDAVLAGDLQPPHQLFAVELVEGAGAHGGIVAEHETFSVLDHADAHDEAGADGIVRAPRRQGADLQERRVAIQRQADAFAQRQLVAGTQPRHGFGAAAIRRFRVKLVELRERVQHVCAILAVGI